MLLRRRGFGDERGRQYCGANYAGSLDEFSACPIDAARRSGGDVTGGGARSSRQRR